MADFQSYPNIPIEKLQFASGSDLSHDKKPQTKPVGYLCDALNRFCKNKGAVVAACIIFILVLFAIIAPFCTPYDAAYSDPRFAYARPKSKLFANTSFWDGCEKVSVSETRFVYLYAMGQEAGVGHYAIKNQEYTKNDGLYTFREDTYHHKGMLYQKLSLEQYELLQKYQDDTGIQVIYPTVAKKDRPMAADYADDANIYYKTEVRNGKTQFVRDDNGNVIPVYYSTPVDMPFDDGYHSLRIASDNFVGEDGKSYQYVYALKTPSGVECRVNYYEYYIFNHKVLLKDGIEEPYFVFGTTGTGKDILTCLSLGARFSFLFAIAVAVVNMFVGAIYGSVAGYYGGKIDLFMERVTDILGAVPTMIVITLLKLHMGGSSQALVLFIAFFMTGWIGMAGTTRMQFYRFKKQEYVLAARTLGAKDGRLMFKHIFPNAIGTLVTSCALVIPSMIYSETNLTYLGIINLESGNLTSVGTLIAAGQQSLATAPFVALFPSVFLALMMLSFNLFGNGLRDAFNSSLRGSEG